MQTNRFKFSAHSSIAWTEYILSNRIDQITTNAFYSPVLPLDIAVKQNWWVSGMEYAGQQWLRKTDTDTC